MSEANILDRPGVGKVPSDYFLFDSRWLCLAGACCLWLVAFWQLTEPVAAFLAEAGRVRMMLPYHIRWVSEVPWLAVAVVGSLAALAMGPRLRTVGNGVLIALPLVANAVIHLSLHATYATAARGLMMYH
jgi:hypothetical protein